MKLPVPAGHYRAAFLTLTGTVEIIYGTGLITASGHRPDTLHWWPGSAGQIWDIRILTWGIIWCAIGAVTAAAAFWARHDRWLFALAALLNGTWALTAIHGWVNSREAGAWAPAAIYAGITTAILLISAWPEPPAIDPGKKIITRAETIQNGARHD